MACRSEGRQNPGPRGRLAAACQSWTMMGWIVVVGLYHVDEKSKHDDNIVDTVSSLNFQLPRTQLPRTIVLPRQ